MRAATIQCRLKAAAIVKCFAVGRQLSTANCASYCRCEVRCEAERTRLHSRQAMYTKQQTQ